MIPMKNTFYIPVNTQGNKFDYKQPVHFTRKSPINSICLPCIVIPTYNLK